MSLCFNWSCDFQRFTKSKKLSKFQVRTTTLFISNKILSTSLFNLQGTIRCFKKLSFSFAACLLYQMKFRLSRTFFQNFFEVFEAILSKLKLFWPPSLSKQLIYYIKPKPVCQELFSFFSSRAACNIKCERTNTTSNDGYAFYRIYFFTINRAKTQ